MKVSTALDEVGRLYIDSVTFIYFVEDHPTYRDVLEVVFNKIDALSLVGLSSVITISEVWSRAIATRDQKLVRAFSDVLLSSPIELHDVTHRTSVIAANLRATYKFKTPDALHIATALVRGCEAFLTNDRQLIQVSEINVLILDELTVN